MEEMQQKGEAWKVLHHLYITYKEEKKWLYTTQNISHTHTTLICTPHSKTQYVSETAKERNRKSARMLYGNETNIAWSFNMSKQNQSTQYKRILLRKVLEFMYVSEEMT